MGQKSGWTARISTFILSGWWKMRDGSLYGLVNQPDSVTPCLSLAGKDAWINASPVGRLFWTVHLEPYPRYTEHLGGPLGLPLFWAVVQQSRVLEAGSTAAPLEWCSESREEEIWLEVRSTFLENVVPYFIQIITFLVSTVLHGPTWNQKRVFVEKYWKFKVGPPEDYFTVSHYVFLFLLGSGAAKPVPL